MATAEATYVDPSALARLYLHQDGSRAIALWRSRTPGCLAVTHHGRTEMVNAICRAAFLGELDEPGMEETLADLKDDFEQGHLQQADILWRSALNRAAELSRLHTPGLGTRALDVLHVACALELRRRHFLTFDERQRRLAAAAGLKVVTL